MKKLFAACSLLALTVGLLWAQLPTEPPAERPVPRPTPRPGPRPAPPATGKPGLVATVAQVDTTAAVLVLQLGVKVDPDARVTVDGKTAKLADLKPGMMVRVQAAQPGRGGRSTPAVEVIEATTKTPDTNTPDTNTPAPAPKPPAVPTDRSNDKPADRPASTVRPEKP